MRPPLLPRFLSKKRRESCLQKVTIGGESVGDTTLFHH